MLEFIVPFTDKTAAEKFDRYHGTNGELVRCRDCKHRPTDKRSRDDDVTGFAIEFPDSSCPCQCEDGWYNWYSDDDWFCGNGERRDDDAVD